MKQKIKIVFTDVDGVWTDGKINYTDNGFVFRSFNVLDSLGVSILKKLGIVLVVLTGEDTGDIKMRFNELKIKHIYTGLRNKSYIADDVMKNLGFSFENAAFIGDDISDLPLLSKVAISAAPFGVADYIAEKVTWNLSRKGGEGVFREFAEKIAFHNGEWDLFLDDYLKRISKTPETM
ncbi:MAG: 3-deoxy-D-manno-octulosonate 8-phosphate [Bacteroidetes bacterium]|nr:MAG: 3-deoxy-D-manno-octulosonate 8-phosphate [Bacteroidota bacterium]